MQAATMLKPRRLVLDFEIEKQSKTFLHSKILHN